MWKRTLHLRRKAIALIASLSDKRWVAPLSLSILNNARRSSLLISEMSQKYNSIWS